MTDTLATLYRKRDRLQRVEQTKTSAYQKAKQAERKALREWLDIERKIMEFDRAIALQEISQERALEEITPPLTDAGVRPSAEVIQLRRTQASMAVKI